MKVLRGRGVGAGRSSWEKGSCVRLRSWPQSIVCGEPRTETFDFTHYCVCSAKPRPGCRVPASHGQCPRRCLRACRARAARRGGGAGLGSRWSAGLLYKVGRETMHDPALRNCVTIFPARGMVRSLYLAATRPSKASGYNARALYCTRTTSETSQVPISCSTGYGFIHRTPLPRGGGAKIIACAGTKIC